MFLGHFVVKNDKNALGHFLKGPKRTKFGTRENREIIVNSVKEAGFDLQRIRIRHFARYVLES